MKRRKKPLLVRMKRKADAALSLFVREVTQRHYGNCPLCKTRPIQACFHFITRKRKILRWDIRNVIGTCHSCNYLERWFPDVSRAWFINTYGVDKYLTLVEEAQKDFEPSVQFLENIMETYQTKLKEIKK